MCCSFLHMFSSLAMLHIQDCALIAFVLAWLSGLCWLCGSASWLLPNASSGINLNSGTNGLHTCTSSPPCAWLPTVIHYKLNRHAAKHPGPLNASVQLTILKNGTANRTTLDLIRLMDFLQKSTARFGRTELERELCLHVLHMLNCHLLSAEGDWLTQHS